MDELSSKSVKTHFWDLIKLNKKCFKLYTTSHYIFLYIKNYCSKHVEYEQNLQRLSFYHDCFCLSYIFINI